MAVEVGATILIQVITVAAVEAEAADMVMVSLVIIRRNKNDHV